MKQEFKKIRPSALIMDPSFNREFDVKRATAMARPLDVYQLGVPVISGRSDGSLVIIDGQHRMGACKIAGYDHPTLCEVIYGLSIEQEAKMFLKLNGKDRKSVVGLDKYRAQLVAKEPVATDIERTLKKLGLRVTKAPAKNAIQAIRALENVYHRGNLIDTLTVLVEWSDGEAAYFEKNLLLGISAFLSKYPQVIRSELARKLRPLAPDRVVARIRNAQGVYRDMTPQQAATAVLREIYNQRRSKKLPPPDSFDETAEPVAEAAE